MCLGRLGMCEDSLGTRRCWLTIVIRDCNIQRIKNANPPFVALLHGTARPRLPISKVEMDGSWPYGTRGSSGSNSPRSKGGSTRTTIGKLERIEKQL